MSPTVAPTGASRVDRRTPRYPEAVRRDVRSRACPPYRFDARRLVVRVGGRTFYPHLATFEELVLPDRHNLLHALDHVAARREGVGPVRACRGDDDAGFADSEAPVAMVTASRFPAIRDPPPGKSGREPSAPSARMPRTRGGSPGDSGCCRARRQRTWRSPRGHLRGKRAESVDPARAAGP